MKLTWLTFERGVKIVVWLLPLLLLGHLLNKNFVPGGELVVRHTIANPSPLVSSFASKEKETLVNVTDDPAKQYQLITASPLYFNVTVPRLFPEATIGFLYDTDNGAQKMQLGVRQPNGAYAFVNFADFQSNLEELPPYWRQLRDGDRVLWQKDKEYYDAYVTAVRGYGDQLRQLEEAYGDPTAFDQETQIRYDEEKQTITTEHEAYLEELANSASGARYDSVSEFFNDPPPLDLIAVHDINLAQYIPLPGYEPATQVTELQTILRGPHTLFTYLGEGERLDTYFTFQDINRHKGADPVTVTVYDAAGGVVVKETLPDDGETSVTGVPSVERDISLVKEGLPFGTYRIEVDVEDDDIFIKKIASYQHRWVFQDRIYLASNEEYAPILGPQSLHPTTLVTSAERFTVTTSHPTGFQQIRVNDQPYYVDTLHEPVSITAPPGLSRAYVPKNDVRIEGKGLYALSSEQYFDPFYGSAQAVQSAKILDAYDYIIANYPKARERGGWTYAEATVRVPQLYINQKKNNTIEFIITLQGLPEAKRTLQAHGIEVTFTKDPLTPATAIKKVINKLKGVQ